MSTPVSQERKKVLVMGLKSGAGPSPLANAWSAERVLEVVNGQIELGKQQGFDMTNYQVDIAKPRQLIVSEVRALLKSQHWDGVSVGYSVRGKENMTCLFEQIMNAVVEEQSPPPKLIFSLRPSNLWEAVKRVFGVEEDPNCSKLP